ncbi:MAG TPA: proprotein convertase P-domain-containing protein [Lysobacter sp.]
MALLGSYNGAKTYTNATDYGIADNATVESSIAVSGRSGNAPANALVSVNIKHTYKGDLKVDLVSPRGIVINLHDRTGGSEDNLIASFSRNLSAEPLNGTWKLRVNDNAGGDVGKIDYWQLSF